MNAKERVKEFKKELSSLMNKYHINIIDYAESKDKQAIIFETQDSYNNNFRYSAMEFLDLNEQPILEFDTEGCHDIYKDQS